MSNTNNFIISIIVIVAFCFGLAINSSINTGIRFAECKAELATQTKLDAVNIAFICSEVYVR
jgi:hypothetical protein